MTITSFLVALAWPCLVAWLLFRAVRQYRNFEVLSPQPPSDPAPSLTVVVPARDEARNIERCLAGLLAQDYPADRLRIVVIDDNSRDGTAERARRVAQGDPRVLLVAGRALPPGWTGKAFACWQGSRLAPSEWLCFVDADTVARPPCLSSAVRVAGERRIDMLSLGPFQEMVTASERLVMLAGFLTVAVFKDLSRINRRDTPEAEANGQFILVRRATYEAVGGHAGVRSEICEDYALARAVKGAGHRLAFLGGNELISARMYTSWRALKEGLSKNAVGMIGGSLVTILASIAAILIGWTAYALPIGLWLAPPAADPWPLAAASLATLGSAILIATHIAEARYFRIPWWYGLAFPAGYTLMALIALNAALQCAQGRTPWKGRVYPVRSQG